MKKAICILIVFSFVFCFFASCEKPTAQGCPFADIRWTRTTDSDTEYIRFSSSGEFSYYCACGNPVNDSDLCTGYSYNSANRTVTLKYIDSTVDAVTRIKVIKYTESELVLDFNGDERTFIPDAESEKKEIINYLGKEYYIFRFNDSVFTYEFNADFEAETDEIIPIDHGKWSFICFNGEIYAPIAEHEAIISNYLDSANYTWSVYVDVADSDGVAVINLNLNDDEIRFLQQISEIQLIDSISFDDVQVFGTLSKTFEDGFLCAKTDLFFYNDSWYWRSGIDCEKDSSHAEYVVKLPESMNSKIKNGD